MRVAVRFHAKRRVRESCAQMRVELRRLVRRDANAELLGEMRDAQRLREAGRSVQVGDLTGAFVYLASDASSLMTGTSMIIDGGWTAD